MTPAITNNTITLPGINFVLSRKICTKVQMRPPTTNAFKYIILFPYSFPDSNQTACAIAGIVLPSFADTCDNNAPVGTNNTLFHSPLASFGNITAESINAEQAHPLPPAWVS